MLEVGRRKGPTEGTPGSSWPRAHPAGSGIAIIWPVITRLGRYALTIAVALALGAISSCGSSTVPPKLTRSQASRLRLELANVRSAVSAHNRARAQLALDAFSRAVAQDAAAGYFSAEDLQALRTGITQTRHRIALEVSAPPATPTTANPSSPTPQTPLALKQKHHPKGAGYKKGPGKKGPGHKKGPH